MTLKQIVEIYFLQLFSWHKKLAQKINLDDYDEIWWILRTTFLLVFSFQDCVTYKAEPRAWNGDILDHLSLN